jgi:uncharacterized protein involved in response to NO
MGQARATVEMDIPVGVMMLMAGIAHLVRQARWCPDRTWHEPLLWILHLGYLFVPTGFLLTGLALLVGNAGLATAGIHAWTAGAIGLMTLAVMTRATRGHSGLTLQSPWTTTWLIYAPAIVSVSARIAAAILPLNAPLLLSVSSLAWATAFISFVVLYRPGERRGRPSDEVKNPVLQSNRAERSA